MLGYALFSRRDDDPRKFNQIGKERRFGREANVENKLVVDRAVNHTPRTVNNK